MSPQDTYAFISGVMSAFGRLAFDAVRHFVHIRPVDRRVAERGFVFLLLDDRGPLEDQRRPVSDRLRSSDETGEALALSFELASRLDYILHGNDSHAPANERSFRREKVPLNIKRDYPAFSHFVII